MSRAQVPVLARAIVTATFVALWALHPDPASAQRDTAAGAQRRPAPDTIADSLRKPPISPRRAMLLSLALPGAAQARLRRPHAAMLFAAFEAVAVGMARKSAMDLRAAREAGKDSVPTGFTTDSVTGRPVPTGYAPNRLAARVRARRLHYEDWLAAIVFNHVIAAADAYVAANLWDFTANVSLDPARRSATLRATLPF